MSSGYAAGDDTSCYHVDFDMFLSLEAPNYCL
jgi:hypothetical protein